MRQCLRCNKPSNEANVFCENCLLLLKNLPSGEEQMELSEMATAPQAAVSAKPEGQGAEVNEDLTKRITIPTSVVEPQLPQTPAPTLGTYANPVEHAFHKLSEAARRIAALDRGQRHGARPRVSRLAPLRDISAEIQRYSTPMPKISANTQVGPNDDLGKSLPDLWPWLHDVDIDENESDLWANHTDPLMSRRIPNSFESTHSKGEEMRRAAVAGLATSSIARQHKQTARLRAAFFCLAILAVLALTVDSILVSVAILHPRPNPIISNGPPTLTLSTNTANYGQHVTLQIRHFSSLAHVSLTRDIEEPIQIDSGSSVIQVGRDGNADALMLIENRWSPGFHTIEAEDTTTRYTANATIQIIAGPTRPSHLMINVTSIDLGAATQGANTIQPLDLQNSGSGPITWSASSNKPWLQVSPSQGVFSSLQTIEIGGQRTNLRPGDYEGKITFSSNVGGPQDIDVTMIVRSLPTNAGAVLSITPAVLSFIASDGGADPSPQFLMISNPGSQPLFWTLGNNSPTVISNAALASIDPNSLWLSIDQTSGVVVPGVTAFIRVTIHSQNLLPGTYINTLVFGTSGSHTALNSPQSVSISLTVQQPCGITMSTGSLSFTSVAGNGNPSNQTLSLAATASCPNIVGWQATSLAQWLVITPASGQLQGMASTATTIGINTAGLNPGTYPATINVTAAQTSQSVAVQLTIQAPPPPTAPILNASPLNLNFSTTLGQPNPPGQAVTITNTGGSPLMWRTTVNMLASFWLGASPSGGTILPGQTAQLTVHVNASSLTPGTYVGQVILSGTDTNNATASGSPQNIMINFNVLPPCTLEQPSSSALAFNALQGGANPPAQSITLTATGNCNWPLNWSASVPATPWLVLSPASGSFTASGQSTTFSVAPTIAGLAPGPYTVHISITATDSNSQQAQGSPQTVSVTLTVLQPCQIQITPGNLTFAVTQGATSSAVQNLGLSESGSCSRPVSWTATGDGGSTTWLVLSATSGADNGNGGTIGVSINATNLTPGTYTATITITAIGSSNGVVQNSPQTISVTVTVT